MLDRLDEYNVIWDSPSVGASGSMPLGNGDIGVNVWVEQNGDLLLLLGKTDAWDENASLLKLGRVRIRLTPNPFASGNTFLQTLKLRSGHIQIALGDVTLRVWVDANLPTIRIDAQSGAEFVINAILESWRTEPRTIKTQTSDLFKNLVGKNSDPYPTVVSPDHILRAKAGRIAWCHHNLRRELDGFAINMKLQGLGDLIEAMPHPLEGRTFGGSMWGDDFTAISSTALRSSPARNHTLQIVALTSHPATIDEWEADLNALSACIQAKDRADAWREHEQWWADFWERSWIFVTAQDANQREDLFHLTQGYVLQRFMNAAAGRGAFPIKHNGSIFSVGTANDPDYRRWGGPGFWFQNQRLIYWPMLAAGDFDLMRPWFAMYRNMLPLQQHRTRTYFHHAGAHYPETVMFWGAEVSAHYGWTSFEKRHRPEAECAYLTYYWSGGIELVLMMCEYFSYTNDAAFAQSHLFPIADAVIDFFDLRYPRDPSGKIRFEPAQALETWHEAVNPLPEIAGLRYTLERLLALPTHLISGDQHQRWTRLLGELPELPVGQIDGQRRVLPAERFDRKKNTENPELYCIFPYRLFGIGKPNLQLAADTFAARLHRSHECWSQDEIQMALLGLTEQLEEFLVKRASPESHNESRFPAFWNAFHDWVPDVDHGGVLQMALQFMLVQPDDTQILLLPSWPREWDADFKLHAPDQTIVEGSVRNGQMADLKITRPVPAEQSVIE